MENASKALIMAAGVLIGIMVLSLAVYLFVTFGSASVELHGQIEQDRINQFNAQFTTYQSRQDITIYDIITVANLAKDNNEYYGLTSSDDSNYYISVSIIGKNSQLEKADENTLNNLIIEDLNESNMVSGVWDDDGIEYKRLRTYSCTVTISTVTNLVKSVVFESN